MGLLDSRRNDIYPQGRDNCMQFLRECQMRGLCFKIKARKTQPYWTWFYEVNLLPPHLSAFTQYYDADQTWDCNPGDVPKEMGLLDNRRNDIYPQGRDNCMQFLRECQMRGYRFRVKARKTTPYWTWYYEVVA